MRYFRKVGFMCTKHDVVSVIVAVIVFVVFNAAQISCGPSSLPVDYLPQVEILEIVSNPFNRSSSVNLWKDRNSDVIIGEDTGATSRILMKCNATYPVQWVYLGDGKPEFTTFTNVRWQEDPDAQMSFEAEASLGLLGFQGVLREEDTGNYTCRSIQEPNVHSYYYIYVPGDGLFAAPNGTNITYSDKDQYVRIPCGVSHPKASVSLCKKDKNLVCPVNGASGFNVKGGFLLNLKKQRDPRGTYVCTANYKGAMRIVEHNLIKEGDIKTTPKPITSTKTPPTYPPGSKNLCNPSPCGKQAECSIVDGRAVCYCFRGLNGNPYDECLPGRCRSSKDCPRGKFCRQGECTSDPCSPSPCGKGGECTIHRGNSRCSCSRGFTGLPPNCVKSCNENYECSEDEACIKSICQSPCPGPCGQNAECRVLSQGPKRTAQCSCPIGFMGDSLKSCYKVNSTTPGPWNNCPPNYVGQPPSCIRKDCELNTDCLYGRKCVNFVCDKGANPACKDKCGHFAECKIIPGTDDAVCTCPPGTTGNPMVVCTSNANELPPPTSWGDPCKPNPCKGPAECKVVQGSRLCIPTTYPPSSNQPPTRSTNAPCRYDGECPPEENCVEGTCQDLCNGLCGYNAICEPAYLRKYRSIHHSSANGKLIRPSQQESTCRCRQGFEGNPYVSCIAIRSEGPPQPPSSLPFGPTNSESPVCFPNPCGRYAECTPVNNAPLCRCFEGTSGDPYRECRYPEPPRPSIDSGGSDFTRPTPARTTPVIPFELDSQGHSWGHHTDLNLNTREPYPAGKDRDRHYFFGPTSGGSRFNSRPPYRDRPYPPSPPSPNSSPNYKDYAGGGGPDRNFPPADIDDFPLHSSLPPQQQPWNRPSHKPSSSASYPTQLFPTGDTPTPHTLGRPMAPFAPMPEPQAPPPPPEDQDECYFRNPYADYDMDSCGVGRRCERDFRGIKKCVCISPFDCTGPTSIYIRGKCQTNRDCLMSDHTCINGTCGDPCSPSYSPCAGIAFSDCRVIEGNVLCTCRRGFVGNPASGLDCRPKRSTGRGITSGPVYYPSSSSVAGADKGDRNLLLIHYLNGSDQVVDLHDSHYNISTGLWNNNMNETISDNDDEERYNDTADEDEEGDVIISSGSEGSASDGGKPNNRHHRRHNANEKDEKKDNNNGNNENDLIEKLLGHCGFGSGHNCDEKSHCRVIGGQPMCVCKVGYRGEFPNCKPECEKNEDCAENMACQYRQCMDPCIEEEANCAENAFCRVANHSAGCECEVGFIGVPWIQCTKIGDSEAMEDCMGFNCEKRNSK